MAPLAKQPVNINFSQGLDTKSDPYQIAIGRFLELTNTVFTTGTRLDKRNGYGALASLPNNSNTFVTTFNGNLTAVGTKALNAYSKGSNTWVTKGNFLPVSLSVLPTVRSSTNQTQADTVVASSGLACTVYTDVTPSGTLYKYVVADSMTGQNIIAPTVIPPGSGVVTGSPRVFLLGRFFVIVFTNVITAVNHLQYIAINTTSLAVTAAADLSTQYTSSSTVAWDGVVANNSLYLAWNGNDGGGAIRMTSLDSTLVQHSTVTFTTKVATHMAITADTSGGSPVIYAAFYNSGSSTGFILAVNHNLTQVLAPTQWISAVTVSNVTVTATSSSATIFYEVTNAYTYDGAIPTHFVRKRTCTQTGTLGTATTVARSVGLASKAFLYGSTPYFLATYASSYQPSYFLMDSSGNVVSKLAYQNGGGYLVLGLPSAVVTETTVQVAYLYKDLIAPVNKAQGVAASAGVYSQTGVNLASFALGGSTIVAAEIGDNLHLSGGFLWMYDGVQPVEQGFHLWPDNVEGTTATTGGLLTAQIYFYQALYEWTDNHGNIHRSAPSIPVKVDVSGSGTATNSNTVYVPTLRLTYKTATPIKIVLYRWSTAQQTYYQVTSITTPTLNDPTVDYVTIVDTLADTAIIGNSILYTTGGVLEDIAAPATSAMTLWQSRLFLLDAEDPNLIWYSKQVIENTPVEMTDLLTLYIAPTIGAQGNTGPTKALGAMDDKLVICKADALYYITGAGPDNSGANAQYSDPIPINSTVGCSNQASIVLIPQGLMFQSDKGIWLLGRDLSTQYIGAPVEAYNSNTVLSAVTVPGTNQVRFTLDNGATLMYDYFFGQWGTFTNVPAVSSTIYQGLHTYINDSGAVFQETPGKYLDGSSPVLMGFKTGWMNLAGLQGFERFYEMLLLGKYITPFKLSIQLAFDYADFPEQNTIVTPDNYSPAYGNDPGVYGSGSPYGGKSSTFEARIFPQKQKCESFQITLQEIYDPSFGVAAGAGLTLSGANMTVGLKKGRRTSPASRNFG